MRCQPSRRKGNQAFRLALISLPDSVACFPPLHLLEVFYIKLFTIQLSLITTIQCIRVQRVGHVTLFFFLFDLFFAINRVNFSVQLISN